MSSRGSLHPAAAAQGSASAVKQRQVSQLAKKLAELSNRFDALDKQVLVTAEHAARMRELGAMQAATFMASARILTPNAREESQEDTT